MILFEILAFIAHLGQKDKIGKPYILHPYEVAAKGKSGDECVVGLLHDVMEDCSPIWKVILYFFTTNKQYTALKLLNKNNYKDLDEYYFNISKNELAYAVKLNDIEHNLSKDRMEKLSIDNQIRLKNKYKNAFEKMEQYKKMADAK